MKRICFLEARLRLSISALNLRNGHKKQENFGASSGSPSVNGGRARWREGLFESKPVDYQGTFLDNTLVDIRAAGKQSPPAAVH